ncbi:glycoside hydrolase family 16 protein [Sphaerobolus stellatus SS14]|nr:glycoside hydrolase family 16 protein [Sphaerobolus stellatus SS14]
MAVFSLLAIAPFFLPSVLAAEYQLERTYAGSSFFDRWTYYNNFDNLTNGDAIFVSQTVAETSQLTFINSAGNAIIKVDNETEVPSNFKRNTVRIESADLYDVGSLWIADMLHVPYGCSVWPAWWSQALNWPTGGEIDTFEGVNLVAHNQMALHTTSGCMLSQSDNPLMTGLINSTDCNSEANSNQGCVVTDPRTDSYGEAFAKQGGGMFVTEFAPSGIAIWFFERASIPDALNGNNISTVDTSTLGTPVANYSSSSCSPNAFFEAQQLILDITLCGDFAGNANVFAQTCSGSCYNDFVIGPPSGYDNAYFEIKSIKTFKDPSVKSSAIKVNLGRTIFAAGLFWLLAALL